MKNNVKMNVCICMNESLCCTAELAQHSKSTVRPLRKNIQWQF